MKTYNIISHKNRLEAQLVIFHSGNGTIRLDRPVRRFFRFADRLEQEFPLRVDAASLSEGNIGALFFTPAGGGLVKVLLTRLDKILDEIG